MMGKMLAAAYCRESEGDAITALCNQSDKKAIENKESNELINTAFNDIEATYNTSVMGGKYAEIYEGVLHELVLIRVCGLIAISEHSIGLRSSAGEAVAA